MLYLRFNEEGNIVVLSSRIQEVVPKEISYEILFVNDGSSDNTLTLIKQEAQKHKFIKYLSFSRNFGHQAALKAGIDFAKGNAVISLDADLQHPVKSYQK